MRAVCGAQGMKAREKEAEGGRWKEGTGTHPQINPGGGEGK